MDPDIERVDAVRLAHDRLGDEPQSTIDPRGAGPERLAVAQIDAHRDDVEAVRGEVLAALRAEVAAREHHRVEPRRLDERYRLIEDPGQHRLRRVGGQWQ